MTNNSIQPIGMGEGISSSDSLPMHVAKQWRFPLQWEEVEGTTVYCIKDWIVGLTGAKGMTANQMVWKWKYRIGKEDKTPIHLLPYKGPGGRTYPMQFTTDEGLYKIAESLRVTKGRTALRAIKNFLAKAGVFVDEARRDPEAASEKLAIARRNQALRSGKSEEWIATREQGVTTRKQFVARIHALVQDKKAFGPIIGSITNEVYRGAFQSDVKGLRERLGISLKENPRDHFSVLALAYTTIAEETIRIHLGEYSDNDFVPVAVIHNVVNAIAGAIGVQTAVIANALQIDVVSGRKLGDKPLTQGQFVNLLTAAAQPRGLKSGGQSKSQT